MGRSSHYISYAIILFTSTLLDLNDPAVGITHERPSIAARDLARNLLPWMFLVIFLSAIGCTTYYYYHTVSVTSQCQVFMEY
ncbi:hypothetical protein M514_10016 [Trichuris suis]|uniref:Uncharacterized protein n=1 Tax=Trichuris suis TaxID=68888 RepID=A0A085NHA9_9BILA|nr:hypothetical protein M514_10016 [Trichuris suis]